MTAQLAVDLSARAENNARQHVLRLMARHLRNEHGWGFRRIATELEVPERRVRAWLLEGAEA
jgi:hypothetical protein